MDYNVENSAKKVKDLISEYYNPTDILINSFENLKSKSSEPQKFEKAKEEKTINQTKYLQIVLPIPIIIVLSLLTLFVNVEINSFWIPVFCGGGTILGIALLNFIPLKSKIKKRIEYKINKLFKKGTYKKVFSVVIISISIISTMLYAIPDTKSWAAQTLINYHNTMSVNIQKTIFEDVTPTENDNDNNKSEDYTYINFVLDENKLISANLLNTISHQVYMYPYAYETNDVTNYLSNIYNTEKGNYNSDFQTSEDIFLKKIYTSKEIYLSEGLTDRWHSSLAEESELINVIEIEISVSNTAPSYNVFNKISNNYQRLADEYAAQNKDENMIKYYYLMSANYDIISIQYADSIEKFNTSMSRLYYRFNDIRSSNIHLSKVETNRLDYLLEDLQDYAIYG